MTMTTDTLAARAVVAWARAAGETPTDEELAAARGEHEGITVYEVRDDRVVKWTGEAADQKHREWSRKAKAEVVEEMDRRMKERERLGLPDDLVRIGEGEPSSEEAIRAWAAENGYTISRPGRVVFPAEERTSTRES